MEPIGLELFLRGVQAFVAGSQKAISTVTGLRTSIAGAATDPRFAKGFATQAAAMDAYTRAGLQWNEGAKRWVLTSDKLFVSFKDAGIMARDQAQFMSSYEQSLARAGISAEDYERELSKLGLTYSELTPQQAAVSKQWDEMGKSTKDAGEKASGMDKILGSLQRTFIRLGASMAAMIIIRKVIELFGEMIAVSKELESVQWRVEKRIEAMSRTYEGFAGDSERFIEDVRTMGREMKIFTDRDLANAAAELMAMGVPLGATQEDIMALTKFTAELAAINGVELNDAVSAVTTGFTGQSRALKRLGVDVSDATLNTEAYRMGLNRNYNELTQQEQWQVKLNVALRQGIELYGAAAESTEIYAGAQDHATRGAERLAGELGAPLMGPLTSATDLAGELAEKTADSGEVLAGLGIAIGTVLLPVLGPAITSLMALGVAIGWVREQLGLVSKIAIGPEVLTGGWGAGELQTMMSAWRELEDIPEAFWEMQEGARQLGGEFATLNADIYRSRDAITEEYAGAIENAMDAAADAFDRTADRWKEAGQDIADYQAEWHNALLKEDAEYYADRLELLDDQRIRTEDRIQDFQIDEEDRLFDHQKAMLRLYEDYIGNLEDLERESARRIADIEEERAIRGDEILEKALAEQLAALEKAEREGAPENLIKTIRLNIARLQAEMIRTGAFGRKQSLDRERENLEDRKKDLEEDYTEREGRAKEDYTDRKIREENGHTLDMGRLKRDQEDRIAEFDAQHAERTNQINDQYTKRIAQVKEREGEINEEYKKAFGEGTVIQDFEFGKRERRAAEHASTMIALANATSLAWATLTMERLPGPRPTTGPYADQYGAEGIATGPMMRMFGEAGPEYYRHIPLSGPTTRVYHQTQTNTVYFGPNNIRSSRDIGRTASRVAYALGTEAKLRQDFGG